MAPNNERDLHPHDSPPSETHDSVVVKSDSNSGSDLLPVVLVLRGRTPANHYILSEHETTVGRTAQNKVVLDDPSASRHHCTIIYENHDQPKRVPVIVIRDAGSRNGTLVNGQRIVQPFNLKFGDRIQIGNTVLCYVIRTPAEMATDARGRLSSTSIFSPGAIGNTRVATNSSATLTLSLPDQKGTPLTIDGSIEDVSISGLRFRSAEQLNIGHLDAVRPMRTARVMAKLPGYDGEVDVTGRIAWIHRDQAGRMILGLEITILDGESRQALVNFITAKMESDAAAEAPEPKA